MARNRCDGASRGARHHGRRLDRRRDLTAAEGTAPDGLLERSRRAERAARDASHGRARAPSRRRRRRRRRAVASAPTAIFAPRARARACLDAGALLQPGAALGLCKCRHAPECRGPGLEDDVIGVAHRVEPLASCGDAPRRRRARAPRGLALAAGRQLEPGRRSPSGVQNSVVPATLVTQAGTELVSFESPVGGTISVSRNRGAPTVDRPERPERGPDAARAAAERRDPALLPERAGRRADDLDRRRRTAGRGRSRRSRTTSAASTAPRSGRTGRRVFSQDGTGFVNVFRGLNGEAVEERLHRLLRLRRVARGRHVRARPGRVLLERRPETAPSSTSRSAPT